MEKVNKIIHLADNLDLLKTMEPESVDLIYIDPPFNSKRNYNMVFDDKTDVSEKAFADIWSNVAYYDELQELNRINPNLHSFLKMLESTKISPSYLSYLTAMAIRCYHMRNTLKRNGSFYFHCDPTASHYIKTVLDYIFGMGNFRNEIIWHYTGGGRSKSYFSKKHDIIFMYSKEDEFKFNVDAIRVPYKETSGYAKGGITSASGKKYEPNPNGTPVDDVWDIPIINPLSHERLGYPTQKPLVLLERIVEASSNPGDVVADFYLGGGTTIAAAQALGRNWIGCDINYRAIQITQTRLHDAFNLEPKRDYVIYGIPHSAAQLKQMVADNVLGASKNSRFELEELVVKYYLTDVIGNSNKVGDNSIDGTFGFERGGKQYKGTVQVTSGKSLSHFEQYIGKIGDEPHHISNIGVYITFAENVADSWRIKAKKKGLFFDVDRVQILTLEELIDNRMQFSKPMNIS